MSDTKVITFPEPITIGAKTVDSITLREPTVGEVDKAFRGAGGLSAVIVLVSLVTGVERTFIEKIPMTTFKEASQFIELFTSDGPATGENS